MKSIQAAAHWHSSCPRFCFPNKDCSHSQEELMFPGMLLKTASSYHPDLMDSVQFRKGYLEVLYHIQGDFTAVDHWVWSRSCHASHQNSVLYLYQLQTKTELLLIQRSAHLTLPVIVYSHMTSMLTKQHQWSKNVPTSEVLCVFGLEWVCGAAIRGNPSLLRWKWRQYEHNN